MYLNVDRQGCVIKTVAYSLRTDRQTHTHTHTDTGTDKSLKTEGPKILSNDIFYFRTMIIGGPILRPKQIVNSFLSHILDMILDLLIRQDVIIGLLIL